MRAFLVATAKNEAPYFLEWVAHHMEVGFTDIVIFQNDSDDLTHETLSCLRDIGAIQYFYNRAGAGQHQVRAYTRGASLEHYHGADWAMALDLDEFLVVKTGEGRLADLMAAIPDMDVLRINWRIFGSSFHELPTDDLVTDRFRMANRQLGRQDQFGAYKCLFRPAHFTRPGIHQPAGCMTDPASLRHANGSGLVEPDYQVMNYNSTDPGACRHAQINHYITRDLASFMLKSVRGSAHQAGRTIGHRYWTQRNMNFTRDDGMEAWLPRIRARMEALDLASKGRLMELRQVAIYKHLAAYYTMLQEKRFRAFRQFCLARPNAVDHYQIKQEKLAAE